MIDVEHFHPDGSYNIFQYGMVLVPYGSILVVYFVCLQSICCSRCLKAVSEGHIFEIQFHSYLLDQDTPPIDHLKTPHRMLVNYS